MKSPQSVEALETLGRVRLSKSFFMRDFLYSEIANHYGMRNVPANPDLAIEAGKHLCEELLEPLQATFGRIAIRSAYRSREVNDLGNAEGHNCGSSDSNRAAHIWDERDANGHMGAMACIVVPWFLDQRQPGDWPAMAYWIHNHLPYSSLTFFSQLNAFNIGWHEKPQRSIHSYTAPKGKLLADGLPPDQALAKHYQGFPALGRPLVDLKA